MVDRLTHLPDIEFINRLPVCMPCRLCYSLNAFGMYEDRLLVVLEGFVIWLHLPNETVYRYIMRMIFTHG